MKQSCSHFTCPEGGAAAAGSARPRVWLASALALAVAASAPAIQSGYIDVDAQVSHAPEPGVTFSWDAQASWATVEIARRPMGATGGARWEVRGSCAHPARTFFDAVEPGVAYEYRVRRPYVAAQSSYSEAAAFIAVALDAPLVDSRGGVLLVVDDTVASALAPELSVLESDLAGDGWTVRRIDFGRDGAATPTALKQAISNVWASADGPALEAVYLFGRLPVAKSGWAAPDGHDLKPQPADGFYGDMDGVWSDTRTHGDDNVPGDGIFDPSMFPSVVELMVGRVDMANMPSYRKPEIELLRDYLHKSHAFRQGRRTEAPRRASWSSDHLSAERNWLTPLFGTDNLLRTSFQPTLVTNAVLFGAAFGYHNGSDPRYTTDATKLVFGVNFGSGKLYWNDANNAMRGLLAQPDWGLTCVWGARPSAFFHHMGLGLPVGYSVKRTMDNGRGFYLRDYEPAGPLCTAIHIALMGDPTLRLHPVAPPTDVFAERLPEGAALRWSPSPANAVLGYHVYAATHRLGPYARLTDAPVASLAFTDPAPPAGDVHYQVRAVVRETTSAAIYTNASQGAFARLPSAGPGNTAPAAVSARLASSINRCLAIPLEGADADGDPLTLLVTRNPANGRLLWDGGKAVHVPAPGFHGADSVEFVFFDGTACSAPATVSIDVADRPALLEWEFGSPTSGVAQALACTDRASGMLSATIQTGPGLALHTTHPDFQNDALCYTQAPVGGLDPTAYLEWTVAAEPLHRFSLDGVSFALWNNTATRPVFAELRWSDDGFATSHSVPLNGETTASFAGAGLKAFNGGMPFAGELASFAALQDRTASVVFRLYVWYATAASYGGIGKLGGSQADLVVSGEIVSIAPPVIDSPAQATGVVDEPFEYRIAADHDPTGFTATGLPGWARLDGATGLVSGTPDAAGVFLATLVATNAWGGDSLELEITVGCVIEATADAGGSIAPSGRLDFAGGDSQTFAITADPHVEVADVLVDGVSVGVVAEHRFSDIQGNHTIHAVFVSRLTASGTPFVWLASLGYTENFEAAERADLDGDGVPNGREWRDGTDPRDPLSRAASNTVPYAESFENLAGWGGGFGPVAGRMGWMADAGASDDSRILPLLFDYAAGRPPLAGATHTNALAVSAVGGALASTFGDGVSLAGGRIHVDLLASTRPGTTFPAEFTDTDSGIKAGVCIGPDGRLAVYHGLSDAGGAWLGNTVSSTDIAIGSNDWFRLTYTLDATLGEGRPACFQVRVDGVAVTHPEAFPEHWKRQYLATGALPAPSPRGSWFRFATAGAGATVLRDVAFEGSGQVDDLVVGFAEPFPAPTTLLLYR